MAWIDTSQLAALERRLQDVAKKMPEAMREFHEHMGEVAHNEVVSAISSSMEGGGGRVPRWQIMRVGSRGGYAAVRPAGSKEGGGSGPRSMGAITNYLENGHEIRPPTGKDPKYRPRIKVHFVRGFGFYSKARTTFKSKAIGEADAFLKKVADEVGGE